MKLKKDITFIYSDSAEKVIYSKMMEVAKSRGYKVSLTNDKFAKCEIGVYCQHINFPQYSRFSVIMLHDIIQQYSNWPDIWLMEPWNKYDIGILPSNQWVDNWNKCSQNFYAVPRKAMLKVGWPKADSIIVENREENRRLFNERHGLRNDRKTVLYAPAWENDGKQNDFVEAMLKLDVNILIKQWDAPKEKFPQIVANIEEMRKLHENIPGVTILPPKTNIFDVIAVSDILVSEESSTMCEAAMMEIPAVSVSDWLIPDTTPSRFPQCDYDFVTLTKKNELSKCVQHMLSNYEIYKSAVEKFAKNNFANVGKASERVIDILDDVTEGRKIRYPVLNPRKKERVPLKKYVTYKRLCIKRQIYYVYVERNPVLLKIWRFMKRMIKG